MQIDTLTVDWVHIQKPRTSLSFLLGTAKLPNNHQLDIEVHQIIGDFEMAELAFKGIVKSLNFKSTTADNVVSIFPEQAEYILLTNKMLK